MEQTKKETDWFGLWYKIMKERGDNDEPTFGHYDLTTKEVDWFRFSHSDMDGVGVMNYLYNKRGIQLKKFPDLKEKNPPSFWNYVVAFIKLLLKPKAPKPDWKEKNWDLKPIDLHRLSFEILNSTETEALLNHCKKQQVSPCAFLMDVTSKVLLPELTHNCAGAWTLPVNLRPVLKRIDYNSNHSSGILVPVNLEVDHATTINHKIKKSLKDKEHWCVWQVHQIGRLIGLKGMRYISQKSSKKTFMIGSFSYMGPWELPVNDIWVGGPPGSKNFPISIMVMIANSRLSFSLKIHPFILKDQDKTDEFLKLITGKIRLLLAPV